MNKKPTQQEVDQQIELLIAIKPTVLERSMFGDNHHDAIDAQIVTLQERLTDRQVDDRSAFEDDEDYEAMIESGMWKTNVREAAMYAVEWRNGHEADAPVESWKELVRK